MTTLVARCAAAVLCVAACLPAAAAEPGPEKHIRILRVEASPKLDDYSSGTGPGVPVTGFLQREPNDLTPVSEPTTAFLSYDRENLYVAFVCKAANPGAIRARMARREPPALREDELSFPVLMR